MSAAPATVFLYELTIDTSYELCIVRKTAYPDRRRKEMSMSALLRRVAHLDLEPLAVQGVAKANRCARLIFDLFGVWKSKLRGSPRFLHMESRGNQNSMPRRTARAILRRAREANLIFNQAGTNQVSAELLDFFQVGNQEIKFPFPLGMASRKRNCACFSTLNFY